MPNRDEKFPDNGFEAWGGYMQAKIAKLEEQFSSGIGNAEKLTNIFNGVSIFVNGFTVPPADELKELMAKHGGIYHTYQRSDDFVIASNLPDTKVKNMSLSRVVKPEWITDSISANCLLEFKDYLLYRNSKTQPRLIFNQKKRKDSVLEKINEKDNIADSSKDYERKQDIKIKDSSPEVFHKSLIIAQQVPSSTLSVRDFKKSDSVTKTAADPNFISEFYNNSRLHHLSQLGATFKQYINDLRENSNFEFPARNDLKSRIISLNSTDNIAFVFQQSKTIMHIDMDCFFVSVGLRNRPELRGKPIAVTHSKGGHPRPKRPGVDRATEFNLYKQKRVKKLCKTTGIAEDIEIETRIDNITNEDDIFGSMSEIASCSYEARARGVKNGMFMGAALKLCPNLQIIPYDFEGYKEVAYTFYNTISQYTLDIEAVSCDEMYVDCTELLKTLNVSVHDLALALREEIKGKTGCPCSTGFGGNRLQARLATKQAKPDGQFFLTSDLVDEFMFSINLRDLPGVGRQISQKLETLGHVTCGSLQSLSLASLQNHLGVKIGEQLYDQCRGRDAHPLTFYTVRKSVSAEVNYGIRFENNEQCEEFLRQLSAEVHSRMQQFKVIGKCITLKLMVRAKDAPVETAKFMGHGFCDTINKSTTLQNATDDVKIITNEVISICKKQNIDPKEMRGIGIQITKLESINSKQVTRGPISKFFKSKNFIKSEKQQSNTELIKNRDQNILGKDEKINVKNPITPKKHKVISPEKKSPILGAIKPIAGKRRGRPSKSVKLQIFTTRNLMSKFLQGESTSNEVCVKKEPANEHLPKGTPKNVEEKPQGLLSLPWEKVRELLRAWFDSGQTPKPCDVDLIVAYLKGMVTSKNIDKVYILINFIKRRIREMKNINWIEVENCVIEEVQNAMLTVYGKKLYIND
ncbi:DNA repair protein Rev1 [Maniola hyperantus]|uniref:DNA repair protein Rev1 n=1 Tax=Aphantopus hyperantus TaxID=2795564 RepID=UPI0015690125|nr:DNA repair protein REV1 [Maniola hyperantus]